MPTFQTLKNGHIQARVRRKGKDESQVFMNLADAKAWAKKTEKLIDKSTAGAGSVNAQTYTVGDAVAFYFEDHIKDKKSAAEYRYVFVNLPNSLVRERLVLLTRDTVRAWVDDMKKADLNPATISRRVGCVRAAVNYATKHEAGLDGIPNPFKGAKLPPLLKSSSRTRTATDEELDEFYKRIGKRSKHLKDYIFLAIETASRRGELVKLKWADIDFKKSTARLEDTKNGEARDVPLSPLALKILTERKAARGRGEFVFTSQREEADRGHIQPATISRAFRRVRDEIEKEKGYSLNLRLHDLRHTAATRWSEDFQNAFDLQAITGHKDIRSLARYVNKKAEQIAERMKELKK
jgi:integrase